MEDWMHYERVFKDLVQQLDAYPFPFGSSNLQSLYDVSDADLRRLPYPRLRDQAVSVDMVFAQWKGRYLAFWEVMERYGTTPYVEEQLAETAHALRRIHAQKQRLRALLDSAPQPYQPGRN